MATTTDAANTRSIELNPDTGYRRRIPEAVGDYTYQPDEGPITETFLVVWRDQTDHPEFVSIRDAPAFRDEGYRLRHGRGRDMAVEDYSSFDAALERAVALMGGER